MCFSVVISIVFVYILSVFSFCIVRWKTFCVFIPFFFPSSIWHKSKWMFRAEIIPNKRKKSKNNIHTHTRYYIYILLVSLTFSFYPFVWFVRSRRTRCWCVCVRVCLCAQKIVVFVEMRAKKNNIFISNKTHMDFNRTLARDTLNITTMRTWRAS